mgnify:FL=1
MYKLRLRDIRRRKGLTQAELAAMVDVSERVLGAWEREETAITLEDAARCAVSLGCTPNDLCGWDGDGVAPSFSDGGQAALNGYYESMNNQGRETLVQTARLMSGSPDTRIQKDRPEHVRVQEAV